jgi:hypothetical protein
LVSHYTVFSDGLWTALGEPCPKACSLLIGTDAFGCPILTSAQLNQLNQLNNLLNLAGAGGQSNQFLRNALFAATLRRSNAGFGTSGLMTNAPFAPLSELNGDNSAAAFRMRPLGVGGAKLTHSHRQKLKDWLNAINHKWTQLVSSMHCRPNAHQLLHSHGSTLDCSLYGSVYGHCGMEPSTRSDSGEFHESIKCVSPKLPPMFESIQTALNPASVETTTIMSDCDLLNGNKPRLVQPFVCVDYSTG